MAQKILLSHLIGQKRNKIVQFLFNFFSKLRQIYYPSLISVCSIIVVILVMCIFMHSVVSKSFCATNIANSLKDHTIFCVENSVQYSSVFLGIHGVLGAFIFALLIFIAEQVGVTKRNHDRVRVLLKTTWIFLLVVLEIISVCLVVLHMSSLLNMVLIIVVMILSIRATYNTFKVFLSYETIQNEERAMMNDRFSNHFDSLIKHRMLVNALKNYCESSEYNIQASYLVFDNIDRERISFHRTGILSDINITKLERMLSKLEMYANKAGYSLKKELPLIPLDEMHDNKLTTEPFINERYKKTGSIIFLKSIGDSLNGNNSDVFGIPKILINSNRTEIDRYLEKIINRIIILDLNNSDNKEIDAILDIMESNAYEFITNNKKFQLDTLLKTYKDILENFEKILKLRGIHYSYEDARSERNEWFSNCFNTGIIFDSLYRILKLAVKQENNSELAVSITQTIYSLMRTAYKYKDNLLFQQVIIFPYYFYTFIDDAKNKETKKYLNDRCWRYLNEFADYPLSVDFNSEKNNIDQINLNRDFLISILHTYKRMFKEMICKEDTENFSTLFKSYNTLLQKAKNYQDDDSELWRIEQELKNSDLKDKKRKQLEAEKNLLSEYKRVIDDLFEKELGLLLRVAAWCLFKLEKANFENKNYLEMYKNCEKVLIEIPIVDLIKLNSYEQDRYWDCSSWELEERVDEVEATWTSVTFNTNTLFVILFMKKVKDINYKNYEGAIENLNFIYKPTFEHLFSKTIDNIELKKSDWSIVIGEQVDESIKRAKQCIDITLKQLSIKETQYIIESEISNTILNKFYQDLINSFNQQAYFRKIMDMFGCIEDTNIISRQKMYYGYNQILEKEIFIDHPVTSHEGYGKYFGESMGNRENHTLIHSLIEGSKNTKQISDCESSNAIEEEIQYLENHNYKTTIILTTLAKWEIYKYVDKNKFTMSWELDNNQYRDSNTDSFYIGEYKYKRRKIPVFNFQTSDNKDLIMVIDLKKFVILKQFLPFSNKKEQSTMTKLDNIAVKVIDLNKNNKLRNKLLSDNPDWLKREDDKEVYLRQRILLQIKQKFKVLIKDERAATVIKIIRSERSN